VTHSDRLVEAVYDVIDRQPSERARTEVARCALLAVQHRAAQLIEKRPKSERKDKPR
jgi:hypothetical protein